MQGKLWHAINAIVTTFVIIYPMLILKEQPFYATIISIVLAVIVNSVLHPEWRMWSSFSEK